MEADNIRPLARYLLQNSDPDSVEILVSDGGSTDKTIEIAAEEGVVSFLSPHRGRASQMNYAASRATGDILYFVHADCFPPASFVKDILASIDQGFDIGRYRTKFNTRNLLLKFNAFFTRFDWFMCYGGDQTLFITQKLFKEIGGYNADMLIMEDYDIVVRAREIGKYKVMPGYAFVSARKYDTNNWLTVQKANSTIVKMYKNGATQKEMADAYKRMLVYR